MGTRIYYDDITSLGFKISELVQGYREILEEIAQEMSAFAGQRRFRGETANQMKNYINEVHLPILSSIFILLQEIGEVHLLYKDEYYENIDSDPHAILDVAELENVLDDLSDSNRRVYNEEVDFISMENQASHEISASRPVTFDLESTQVLVNQMIEDLIDDILDHESSYDRNKLSNFRELLSASKTLMDNVNGQSWSGGNGYQSESVKKVKGFEQLYVAANDCMTGQGKRVKQMEAAVKRECDRYGVLEQEWADQRVQHGIDSVMLATGAIVIGGFCIVATGGIAAPAVVGTIGGVLGSTTIIYGGSKMVEGISDVAYGSNSDYWYEKSINPLRDTMFLGDQEAFDRFGGYMIKASSLYLPMAGGMGFAAATGQNVDKVVALAYGKVVVSGAVEYASGKGTGQLAQIIASNFTDDEKKLNNVKKYGEIVGGMVIGGFTEWGLDNVQNKYLGNWMSDAPKSSGGDIDGVKGTSGAGTVNGSPKLESAEFNGDYSQYRNTGTVTGEETVTYYRVQGGGSKDLLIVNEDGTISLNTNFKSDHNLNVSTGSSDHATYFQNKRPDSYVIEFEVPNYVDDIITENAISQNNYKANPLNQGGTAPKIVDSGVYEKLGLDGVSYEIPSPISEWLIEFGKNAKISK